MLTVALPEKLAAPTGAPRIAACPYEVQRAVEQTLYRQADALDGKRWQDFIDCFAKDGVYWAPARPDQVTGDGEASIFYEDRDLMAIRMKRMGHPRAWSQKTQWGTSHVVSNVIVERYDAKSGDVECRSRFYMMEFRRDAVRHFSGSYVHHLRNEGGTYKIKLQRVDMVNGEAPYEYVLQAWV